jgi:hypothetical protein
LKKTNSEIRNSRSSGCRRFGKKLRKALLCRE